MTDNTPTWSGVETGRLASYPSCWWLSAPAELGLPPVQPLLKLLNSSMTVCYANGVTNILLSTPLLVHFFLALSSPHPLVLALQGLC